MSIGLLLEAADSLAKASTPEPWSSSKTSNWVARAGGLPAYIQHISHDLLEQGRAKTESEAIRMAIGIVKHPPHNWGPDARAAAAKAAAEWEAKKAGTAGKVKESYRPSLADMIALRDCALAGVAALNEAIGPRGMVELIEQCGELLEAAAWAPVLKRTASATDELERHNVLDGSQKCGMVAKRSRMGSGARWHAFAVNGSRLGGYDGHPSRDEAVKTLQTHLEEAPARVLAFPQTGEYLVAQPSTYSGNVSYQAFPSQAAARHAAGLPQDPTVPEINSSVAKLGEALLFDLTTLSGLDIPPLAAVQEARRAIPFDAADRLAEDFHPDEARGFHGRWIPGVNAHRVSATSYRDRPHSPSRVAPGPRVPSRAGRAVATERYQGGVTRASAKARAQHAAKPQLGGDELARVATRRGAWSKSARQATRDISAGRMQDTEHAHRTHNPDGSLGKYTKERQQLHEEIITKLLQGKGVHARPRAVFTAGGGGSGKSAMIKAGHVQAPADAVHVDPDVIKTMLPEYEQLKAAGSASAASQVHEESSHLAKVLTRIALGRGHHILVDSVGNSGPGKFAGKVLAAQRAGHQVSVHYATTSVAEALRRNANRSRTVEPQVIRDAHQGVSQRFPEIARIPGIHLQVFDTTGRSPRLIAEKKPTGDKLAIIDAGAHQAFLNKAKG